MGFSVIFDNKLGSWMANLESFCCPVDGHSLFDHQFYEFLSLLNGKGSTFVVMTECAFFNSLSLLYYSSANCFDIPLIIIT